MSTALDPPGPGFPIVPPSPDIPLLLHHCLGCHGLGLYLFCSLTLRFVAHLWSWDQTCSSQLNAGCARRWSRCTGGLEWRAAMHSAPSIDLHSSLEPSVTSERLRTGATGSHLRSTIPRISCWMLRRSLEFWEREEHHGATVPVPSGTDFCLLSWTAANSFQLIRSPRGAVFLCEHCCSSGPQRWPPWRSVLSITLHWEDQGTRNAAQALIPQHNFIYLLLGRP